MEAESESGYDAFDIWSGNLQVEGQCCVEVYSGAGRTTLGLRFHQVPHLRPWDIDTDARLDVLKSGHILLGLVQTGFIVCALLAQPCQLLSFCRHPQLRSWQHPWGIPQLGQKQAALVHASNMLVMWTLFFVKTLHEHRCHFIVENPMLSWLWHLIDLMGCMFAGSIFKVFAYTPYGALWQKYTCLWSNSPHIKDVAQPVERPPAIVLRGQIWYRNAWVFLTRLAQEYPPALGMQLGSIMGKTMATRATAIQDGKPIPMACKADCDGNPLIHKMPAYLYNEYVNEAVEPEDKEDNHDDAEDEGEQGAQPSGQPDKPAAPWVIDCPGCPRNLTIPQQVEWALQQDHPLQQQPALQQAGPEYWDAIQYEADNEEVVINAYRQYLMDHYSKRAKELAQARKKWHRKLPNQMKRVMRNIHQPLIAEICADMKHVDKEFPNHVTSGFNIIGHMPRCGSGTQPLERPHIPLSEEELRAVRYDNNVAIINRLRENDTSAEVHKDVLGDWAEGFMSKPQLLQESDLHDKTLTRRIGVLEHREGRGYRVRSVDHGTESLLNSATWMDEKHCNQGLEYHISTIVNMMARGIHPKQWKRDARKAFRFAAINPAQAEYSWVVYKHNDAILIAQHYGSPFGTTSAVANFHRWGEFYHMMLLKLFKCPSSRYVDDFIGCSKSSTLSGGMVLDHMSYLCGLFMDPAKSADFKQSMVALGNSVLIDYPRQLVQTQLEEAKAKRYLADLQSITETGKCSPSLASKCSGRFSYAVSQARDKQGRAYIRPFYAQARTGHVSEKAGPILTMASLWWQGYCQRRPKATHRHWQHQRKHYRLWTDASGADALLAGVLYTPDQKWYYFRMQAPEQWLEQCLKVGDHAIMMLELMATAVALHTFKHLINGQVLTCFIDNQAALWALLTGASRSVELNMITAHIWSDVTDGQIGILAQRVESKANIADEPTRHASIWIDHYRMTEVTPSLPAWATNFWDFTTMPSQLG